MGQNQRYAIFKVVGFYSDYYIMVATQHIRTLPFPKRTFYWCNESFVFSPLPEVRRSDDQLLSTLNDYFTGEHDKILKEEQSDFEHLDLDDDDRKLGITQKSSREATEPTKSPSSIDSVTWSERSTRSAL